MSAITLDGPTTGYVRKVKIGSETYNFSSRVEYQSNLSTKDPITGATIQLPEKGTSKITQLYSPSPNVWVTSAVLGEDGKWRPLKKSESKDLLGNPYYPSSEGGDYVLGASALKGLNSSGPDSLRNLSVNDGKVLYKKFTGLSDQQVNSEFDVSSNIAPPGQPGTPGLFGPAVPADEGTGQPPTTDTKLTQDENNLIKNDTTNSRTEYASVKYPETLDANFQDCIKFSIIEYKPSGLRGFDQSLAGSRLVTVDKGGKVGIGERQIKASITLPIPGGIRDSNTVNWSDAGLKPFEQAFANIAISELESGTGAQAAQNQLNAATNQSDALRKTIVSKVATAVAGGAEGIMQRQYGRIINPNIELLFNAPELRNFSFIFKLSPRSESEARIVKQIIRNFKQAMSVKRTNSSFLLQSPHTFAISYIFKNKQHPYLNRFKECALKSCSVNYTPEGNYMAFDSSTDPSMVSYELELQFQELEPIFDDEYGIQKDDYNNIGF